MSDALEDKFLNVQFKKLLKFAHCRCIKSILDSKQEEKGWLPHKVGKGCVAKEKNHSTRYKLVQR
jgi:hypothetical protein